MRIKNILKGNGKSVEQENGVRVVEQRKWNQKTDLTGGGRGYKLMEGVEKKRGETKWGES